MSWDEIAAVGGLFLAAFGAATLLPFQSEFALGALLAAEAAPVWALFVSASVGNTLGSVLNYFIGRGLDRLREKRWARRLIPASDRQIARARDWYLRWGVWTLLLSWAPFADPITVVAGILRTPFWLFLTLVAIAKTGRYAAVIWLCSASTWC